MEQTTWCRGNWY